MSQPTASEKMGKGGDVMEETFARAFGLSLESMIVIIAVWVLIALIIFGINGAGSSAIVWFTTFFVFVTAFVVGKLGWFVFLLILAVLIIMIIAFFVWCGNTAPSTSPSTLNKSNNTAPSFYHASETIQPTRLYHGTSLEIAQEIYKTGLWLVGNSRPYAIWMTTNFEKACSYAGGSGAIVEIDAEPFLPLTHRGGGVYIYEIPEAKPNGEFYKGEGLRPVGILSPSGDRIR
jgi:hypothetical protein